MRFVLRSMTATARLLIASALCLPFAASAFADMASYVRLPLLGESDFGSALRGTTTPAPLHYIKGGCPPKCQPYGADSYYAQPGGDAAGAAGGGVGAGAGAGIASLEDEQFAGLGSSSLVVNDLVGGYIDPAVIQSRVRVRYDINDFANFPDRAEYMYPSAGNTGGRGPASGFSGPGSPGNLRVQELHTYIEWALAPRFSIFGDFAVRYVDGLFAPANINPISQEPSRSNLGAGDIQAGFRYGIIADPQGSYGQMQGNYLTAQVRTYLPTGDPRQGLGTGHTSIEAGLLFQRQSTERLIFFGELLDWQAINASIVEFFPPPNFDPSPLNGTMFGGNVLQWGLGASYALYNDCRCGRPRQLSFVYEVVGWNVLYGLKSTGGPEVLLDAAGDTIVNGKYGFRWISGLNTVYMGYGHNYTHDRWYADIYRVEFAHAF